MSYDHLTDNQMVRPNALKIQIFVRCRPCFVRDSGELKLICLQRLTR